MEQSKEMLERFRQMLGAVDDGLREARSRRLGRTQPVAAPPAAPPSDTLVQTSGRPRFKAVRITPSDGDAKSID